MACIHPLHGGRAAPWCKLRVLRELLLKSDLEHLLYLDSDAYVKDPSRGIEAILEAGDEPRRPLTLFVNTPWDSIPACTGIQMWRAAGGQAVALLAAWWLSLIHI